MAQSVTGTNLRTSWASKGVTVCHSVKADWNKDGDFSDTYEDITARVLSVNIDQSLYNAQLGLPFIGVSSPGSARLVMKNEDNWFSPDNGSGLAGTYTDLADGIYRIPIIIDLGYEDADNGDEVLRQFAGEIENAQESEQDGEKVVIFECQDNAVAIRQFKHTTTLSTNQLPNEFMATLLDAGGIGAASRSLDEGMWEIPFCWTDDENIWDECQKLAMADGGMFYFDERGTATFHRLTALLERTDSTLIQGTLDQGNSWYLEDGLNWRDCYTGVIVEWAGMEVGALESVYSSPGPITIPAGGTITESCRFRYPTDSIVTPVYETDYNLVTAGMASIPSGTVSVSVTAYCQRADVAFVNALPDHTAYVLDFTIRGYPLVGEEAQEEEFNATLSPAKVPGTKVYPIRGNDYLQTRGQAELIGGFLRDRLQYPRRLIQWKGPACPWAQLGDRFHLDHNTMTYNPNLDMDCYVLAKNQTYSPDEMWEQTLTLLPVSNVFAHTDYFIVGTSTYADSGSDKVGY